jgi:hypothetical protein
MNMKTTDKTKVDSGSFRAVAANEIKPEVALEIIKVWKCDTNIRQEFLGNFHRYVCYALANNAGKAHIIRCQK